MKKLTSPKKNILKIMGFSFLIGILYWIFDSIIDYFFANEKFLFLLQHEPMDFLDALIQNISIYDIIQRLIFLSLCLLAGIIASFVTYRKNKLEEMQITLEKKFQILIENIPLIIFQKDIEGKYVLINDIALKYNGFDGKDVIGKNDVNILGKEDGEKFLKEDLEIIANGISVDHEIEHILEGQKYYLHIVKTPLKNENGEIIGIIGIGENITQHKRLLADEIRKQKLESLGTLAGGLAHDFNNILMGILGNVELLKFDIAKNNLSLESLDEIYEATIQAKNISYQLMNFAKGHKPQKIPTDIYDLIKKCASFVFHGKKSVYEINSNIITPLIEIDPNQFSQAINNILINADQSMPNGGKVQITLNEVYESDSGDNYISKNENPHFLEIYIHDEGIGISDENKENIFNPYFSTKEAGNGLGLTMTYRIIRNHDGLINFKQNVDKGTTFIIKIPIIKSNDPEFKKINLKEDLSNLNILLMDDAIYVHNTVKKILEKLNCRVSVAVNGYEAIDIYKKNYRMGVPFDVVILDLTIPGSLGGKDTFTLLKEFDPSIKCIVSSGYSEDPILAQYNSFGFLGVLNKPYSIEDLQDQITKALNKKKKG